MDPRRRLIASLPLAALACPLIGAAQVAGGLKRVAVPLFGAAPGDGFNSVPYHKRRTTAVFATGGVVEGKHASLQFFVGEEGEQGSIGRQVVASQPDVVFAMGTDTALLFQRLTRSIPIVFAFSPDPLREGLVKSYQRPGGNLTGTSSRWYELLGKRLELIKEIRPSATKVALLLGPRSELALEQLFIDAPRLGLTLVQIDLGKGQVARAKSSEAASREEVAEAVRHSGASAFMFINFYGISEDMTWIQRQTGIPGVFSHPGAARGGGLLSLGISEADQLKRAAVIVSRVLQGESPSVIPVDQASSFNLIVNLAAARELKLEIPASVRLRANQVIE